MSVWFRAMGNGVLPKDVTTQNELTINTTQFIDQFLPCYELT